MIRAPLFCFSAATIGHVESNYATDDEKNYLCPPIEAPDAATDWMILMQSENEILKRWAGDRALRQWASQHRLLRSCGFARGKAQGAGRAFAP